MPASHDKTHSFISRSHRFLSHLIRRLGLRGRLLLALLPSIVIILMATGYASYKASEEFIDIALERSVKQHTLAISHEMEQHLESCRTDLLFFAQEKMQAQLSARHWKKTPLRHQQLFRTLLHPDHWRHAGPFDQR